MKKGLKNKKLFLLLLILFFISIVFIPSQPASAVSSLLENIDCIKDGDCNVKDLLQVFVNISNWILGILGSVALLMFVIGGVLWIFSGGNEQRVTQGKQIIVGTVVGIALVLGGWLIVKFLGEVLGSKYQLREGPCANKSDGTDCGDNQVCYNKLCVSECEYKVKKGELSKGYACQLVSFCDIGTIEEGFCPGVEKFINVCCISRELTPPSYRGGREIPTSDICCVPGDFHRSCYSSVSPPGCLAGDTSYSQSCSEISTCQEREMVGCCQLPGGCVMTQQTRCSGTFDVYKTCNLASGQCE